MLCSRFQIQHLSVSWSDYGHTQSIQVYLTCRILEFCLLFLHILKGKISDSSLSEALPYASREKLQS